jgi:hypothetical protein
MQSNSRQQVTSLLLQEEKEATVAQAKALRVKLLTLEKAIAHLDLAIMSFNSSPLSESQQEGKPKVGRELPPYSGPFREEVVASLIDKLRRKDILN